jgi:hypothetical protein
VFGRQDGGFRGQAAAACRDSLRWLVNTHPWFRDLGSSSINFQHTRRPLLAPHTHGPRDVPRFGALSLLRKWLDKKLTLDYLT